MNEQWKSIVILRMTPETAWVVQRACEIYGRLRNGQFSELTFELKMHPHKLAQNFDRDLVDAIMLAARKPIFPELSGSIGHHYGVNHDDKADVAFDVHEVLRYSLMMHEHPEGGEGTWFREPFHWGKEVLPKCEIVEDGM